jgi:hypothetical protein
MTHVLEALSATNFSQPLIHDLRRDAQPVRLGVTLPDCANSLSQAFRVSIAQEILLQAIASFHQLVDKIVEAGRKLLNSLLISLHLREFETEPVSDGRVGRCPVGACVIRAARVRSNVHDTRNHRSNHPGG